MQQQDLVYYSKTAASWQWL